MKHLKKLVAVLVIFISNILVANAESPLECINKFATAVDSKSLEQLAVHNQGRLKPFYTFARENLLFVSGRYSPHKVSSIKMYLAMIVCEKTPQLEIINIREPELRVKLGFKKDRTLFSIKELEASPLSQLAQPIAAKEESNSRSLEPEEKNLLELYSQFWLAKRIHSGNQFLTAINFESLNEKNPHASDNPHPNIEVLQAARLYLTNLSLLKLAELPQSINSLLASNKAQKLPELFEGQREKFGVEIFYYKSHFFLVTGVIFLLLGVLSLLKAGDRLFQNTRTSTVILSVPLLLLVIGFLMRVYVTGFAPVTNMYGTMIWVAFGVSLFSLLIYFLYKNRFVIGVMFITSAAFLFLTESIPLILSPSMDPIVAVLRSNLWLTIHVLTIVISYAAFSISMVLGNVVMVRSIFNSAYNDSFVKEVEVVMYRTIQLGVFLLTVGIILGGVWADYSWGRFWGWDPKETWALIADVGYLIILHGRFVGWVKPFGMALGSALAYLLVIFAWYGVNFLLQAGLHSYGFSSGGAAIVMSFVAIQFFLVVATLGIKYLRKVQA